MAEGSGVIVDADTVDGHHASDLLNPLVVQEFRKNPATGTTNNPSNINDNDTGTYTSWNNVGEYCEIAFDTKYYVRTFRYNGNGGHNRDGSYKIQYWDGSAWVDAHTGISTRGSSWSAWITITTPFLTDKVRIVATAIDTNYPANRPSEWEMRGW